MFAVCWVAEVLATCVCSLSKLFVCHVYSSNTLWETVTQVRFRLTRMGACPHVTDLLLDVTGPLQPLHTRVLEAGCEVNPSWNLGCPSWGVLGAGGSVRHDTSFKLSRVLHVTCWIFGRGPEVYQMKLPHLHTCCIFEFDDIFFHDDIVFFHLLVLDSS